MTYASFWKRVAADLIDITIYLILCFIIGLLLMFLEEIFPIFYLLGPVISTIILIACYLYYFVYTESSVAQATWGKRLFGLKVTDLEGKRMSFVRSLGRNLGMFVSVLTLGIGYLMCLWTQQKQCLHDKMANCLIIDKMPQRKQTGLVCTVISIYALIILAMMGILIYCFTTLLPQLEQDIIRDYTQRIATQDKRIMGNVDRKDWTPLMNAIFNENLEQVSQLIQEGADVNATVGLCKNTALLVAVKLRNSDAIRLLLAAGANADRMETTNLEVYRCSEMSPLMYAVQAIHWAPRVDIVKALLEAGANSNAADKMKRTALMYAIRNDDIDMVNLLLSYGAKVNVLEVDGKGPYEGKPVKVMVGHGWSPLMYAIFYSGIDTVKALLDAGADVNLKTVNGDTALKLAQQIANKKTFRPVRQSFIRLNHKQDMTIEELMDLETQQAAQQADELQEIIQLLKQAGAKE